jgi:hypothetical protein
MEQVVHNPAGAVHPATRDHVRALELSVDH